MRSTCPSQKCQKRTVSGLFWTLRCRKRAQRCSPKPKLRSTFRSQNGKKHAAFAPRRSNVSFRGTRNEFCTLSKVSKILGFCDNSKTMAGAGRLKTICQDASRGGCGTRDISSDMLGGEGADFLRRAAFWSIRSSGLLR